MHVLEVNNISKTFPNQERETLRKVTFQLDQGVVMAIVGENGAGKSTLLRIIAGFEDADKGSVRVMGESVTGPSQNLVPGHPRIKMLRQNLSLMPKHTIYENVSYHLRGYTDDYQEEQTLGLLERFRLARYADQRPENLSGGQQQRAALARALAERPDLLLLDEPFSNVDVMLKSELREQLILQGREDGETMIFTTHDAQDALSLADTILVMKNGEVVQLGTPKEIYENPVDLYVANLFGVLNYFTIDVFNSIFPSCVGKYDNISHVGIRPAFISVCTDAMKMIEGEVVRCGYHGDHFMLKVKVSGVEMLVRSEKKYDRGVMVPLTMDTGKILLFKK